MSEPSEARLNTLRFPKVPPGRPWLRQGALNLISKLGFSNVSKKLKDSKYGS